MMERSLSRRKWNKATALAGMILTSVFLSPGAYADSTTSLQVTTSGVPKPGGTISVTATLSGSHITFAGTGTVPSERIHFYANGVEFGHVSPQVNISTGVLCVQISDPVFTAVCHAQQTVGTLGFTLPSAAGQVVTFSAHFDGDPDSNPSTSANKDVRVVSDMSPIIDLILN